MNTRKIAGLGLMTAVALVVFVIENQIPVPIPIPGIKLGLANAVTLFTLWYMGRKEAGIVLVLRIVMGSFICGTVAAMLYSLAGGVLCYAVMCLLKTILKSDKIWLMSIFGAMAHNIGQIIVAVYITQTPAVLSYLPALMLSAAVTGLFTGIAAQYTYLRIIKTRG